MGVAMTASTSRESAQSSHDNTTVKMDIEFSDITYKVDKGKKVILREISGQFRAGKLTAILGSSGAGKSTLLDVLVGFKSTGVTGSVLINGQPRDLRRFHKFLCYLPQEELTQPHLSVLEAMNVAASLKMSLPAERQHARVQQILDTLGLAECRNTMAQRLSGGQRKRLSIALELLSDPAVLFLDEPTTGLDVVNVTQCVQLLRSLATQQGRNVVCTVHQPSAALLDLFHHVYVLAEGGCVYQGSADQLVPFLEAIQRPCPPYNNPVDHVIELTQGPSRHEEIELMSAAVENGRVSKRDDAQVPPVPLLACGVSADGGEFATSGVHQFKVLLRRALLQTVRNKLALALQFLHHLLSAIGVGLFFQNVGMTATVNNTKLLFGIVLFFVYSHVMTQVLLNSTEIKYFRREYFNRWYGLKPYFAASSLARLPAMFVFGLMFVGITYFMTHQPLELLRIFNFAVVGLLTSLVAESLGLMVSSTCDMKRGSIVVNVMCMPLLMACTYEIGTYENVSSYMRMILNLSFMRTSYGGFMAAVYGNGRENLECEEIFCFFSKPELILRLFGFDGVPVEYYIISLIACFVIFRTIYFLVLRYSVTSQICPRICVFGTK